MRRGLAALTSNSAQVQLLKKTTSLAQRQQIISIFPKICLCIICSFTINPVKTMAQVIPDGTLPTSVEQLREIMKINGGERAGNNLFHSFEEFSIPEGNEAVFENALDIENIFTRITGKEASTINGILRTQGGANFFLVNPNGIIFGENAQLDVGGSFIGTTANSIQFEDGAEFSTSESASEPILTINRPIGLDFNGNSGAITVNGKGNQIKNDSSFSPIEFGETARGISVPNGNTLALVGTRIDFNQGVITTNGGQIYLTSIESGKLRIDQSENRLTLIDDTVTQYQDINLNQQSLVNASGKKVGTISLSGQNINLSDGSFLLTRNQGDLSGGSINIKALESLNLSGQSPDGQIASVIRTETLNNAGKGGNINISTTQLALQNTARIQALTFSDAIGGDIKIKTSETVNLNTSFINASTRGNGNAGNLELSTSLLRLIDVGIISSTSIGGNNGDGGKVTVNADFIEISGVSNFSRSNISTSTFTNGNAGNLTINTKNLRISDGASISSSSFNNGDAGNLTINASQFIDISGKNPNFQGSSNSESTIRTAVLIGQARGDLVSLPSLPTGNAGTLTINTPFLNVFQEGVISVENQGAGNGGALSINAKELNLNEAGSITAATASGTGGNIELNTKNLQISDTSEITATAENNGDGGNININTSTLIAKKNSQITANAFRGNGGNIQINARRFFLFPDSTIEASSELGIDGKVKINSLDNNLQKELELSNLNLTTIEELLANSCLTRRHQPQASFNLSRGYNLTTLGKSEFYDSGSITGIENNSFSASRPEPLPYIPDQPLENLIPAQRPVKTKDGRIFLISSSPQPQSAKSLICHFN